MATGNCCSQVRGEFQCSKLGLDYYYPSAFAEGQLRCPAILYTIYRCLAAIFFVVWIVLSGAWQYSWYIHEADRVKWFIYLTNWTFFILTLSTILQAFLAILAFGKSTRSDKYEILPVLPLMKWYIKVNWVVYNISIGAGLTVTLMYWIPTGSYIAGSVVHPVDFVTHAGNAIYLFVDFWLNGTPIRLLHVVHTLVYLWIYIIFSAVYDACGGTNAFGSPFIYDSLDWSKPWDALITASLMVLAVPIVMWLLVYVLYHIRCAICNGIQGRSTYGGDGQEEESPITAEAQKGNTYGTVP